MSKMQQDFLSPSEQDQAILHYRKEAMAPVVRDRLIANKLGSGEPHLQRRSIDIKVLRTFSPCDN